MPGRVVSIHIARVAGEPMQSVESVKAVAGRGLLGDRYFAGEHPYRTRTPDREVTLIETEAIETLKAKEGIEIMPGEARRNIVTEGIRLNELVGREFQVGNVRMHGMRLCEPCRHLEKLTRKGVLDGLVHRGGLRAQILIGGIIRAGDEIAEIAGVTD